VAAQLLGDEMAQNMRRPLQRKITKMWTRMYRKDLTEKSFAGRQGVKMRKDAMLLVANVWSSSVATAKMYSDCPTFIRANLSNSS
jgi:hypothetical protein